MKARKKRKNETDQKNAQETKPANTRKGFYPDDIAGTFGVPVEEHLKESEVKQMDGYVSVGMLTGKTVPDTGLASKTATRIPRGKCAHF